VPRGVKYFKCRVRLIVFAQNGADARAVDHEGHDPLYYAKVSDAAEAALCAQLLQTSQGCRDSFIT